MITYLAITPGATGGASAHGTEGREVEILIVARRARQVPAIALMFGSLLSGGALASAERSPPIGTGLASSAEASKARPAALPGEMIAQAGDLGPPPSPEAIVTTPPPAPLAEDAPPPFPGYSWDPATGFGMARSMFGSLGNTLCNPRMMRPSLPAIGRSIQGDGPG